MMRRQRRPWLPDERKQVLALWNKRPDWTLREFQAEHKRLSGSDRSPISLYFVIKEYVRDGLLPGDYAKLCKEAYAISVSMSTDSKYQPPGSMNSRKRSYAQLGERAAWVKETLAAFPDGIQATEFRQLVFEAGYTMGQMRRTMANVGVEKFKKGSKMGGYYRIRAHGAPPPAQPPNGTSHKGGDAKILKAYHVGAISLDQAIELLRAK